MANNTQKSGNAHKWFPVLLVVLVVLAILTNREKTDSGGGNNSSGGNTVSVGTQQRPDDSVLAAVSEELRDNVFLNRKETGCCKTLSGEVAISVILISDSIGQWDTESVDNLKTALDTGGQNIVSDANEHQVQLSLSFHYYNATMTGDICSGVNTNDWQNPALESAGLPNLVELHDYLAEKYSAKEAPVVFVFNKPGRAFAGGGGADEYVVLYARNDFSAFQHELSHVFGAKDFYYPKEVKTLANAAFPDSIMTSGNVIDPLTAYLIGWSGTVSENVLQFLRDTNTYTAEQINEEREEEQYTGYGTKEFDSGTYTGDLVRGERHGKGTMYFDNGGWYTGEWSYGAQSGKGSGKIVYSGGDVYEGDLLDGKRHGQGTYTFNNGGWLTGSWSAGEQAGYATGKKIYDNGVYEGEFQDGKRHGQGTYTFNEGGWLTGSWSDGEQIGYATGKRIYDGGTYEGEFLDGQRHGQGTYTYLNGDKYTGQWSNGSRHGYGTYTYANGKTRTGNWSNGKFIG